MNALRQDTPVTHVRESSFGGFNHIEFLAMGTSNEVVFSAESASMAAAFRDDMFEWLDAFERRVSRFRTDSLVSEINREAGGGWITVDSETEELLALCDWFHWKTRGIFDPSTLPLTELWNSAARQDRLPPSLEVARTRSLTGWSRFQREPGRVRLPHRGMALDMGGIGKEYAVDKVVALARRHGVSSAMVNFGRDIRAFGHPPEGGPWRIGLERPGDTDSCWCGVMLDDRAICGSGTYARGFDLAGLHYGHILDPRTGWPADSGCRASWAVAPSCTEAGIFSTTAIILGAEEGIRLMDGAWRAAGCIWTDAGAHYSRRFHELLIQAQ
jgi:thiamine biosynthesis lipoprotein